MTFPKRLIAVIVLVIFGLLMNAQAQRVRLAGSNVFDTATLANKQDPFPFSCAYLEDSASPSMISFSYEMTQMSYTKSGGCSFQLPAGYYITSVEETVSLSSWGCFGETLTTFAVPGNNGFYATIVKTPSHGGSVNLFVKYDIPAKFTAGQMVRVSSGNWQLECISQVDLEIQGTISISNQ